MISRNVFVLIILVSFFSATYASEKIHYPRPESSSDSRTEYPVKLLSLAMQYVSDQYDIRPSDEIMLQNRALKDLERNVGDLQVVWSMTTNEREKQLLPIRIPIYKGLIGWRLPLVRKEDAEQFASVSSIDDLDRFEAGQGHDWPDTMILRSNGLYVEASPGYDGLFRMLEVGRFDYFPRSVAEIWAEVKTHASKDLVVDEHIAFRYQAAFYFFVNKDNKKFANALRTGLEMAIADGSFERLFRQYHSQLLVSANLEDRTIIELENPLLPLDTPLERKELWYEPD